jgi:hypothetical protein
VGLQRRSSLAASPSTTRLRTIGSADIQTTWSPHARVAAKVANTLAPESISRPDGYQTHRSDRAGACSTRTANPRFVVEGVLGGLESISRHDDDQARR